MKRVLGLSILVLSILVVGGFAQKRGSDVVLRLKDKNKTIEVWRDGQYVFTDGKRKWGGTGTLTATDFCYMSLFDENQLFTLHVGADGCDGTGEVVLDYGYKLIILDDNKVYVGTERTKPFVSNEPTVIKTNPKMTRDCPEVQPLGKRNRN